MSSSFDPIDTSTLVTVTGGKAVSSSANAGASSGGSNDALSAALTGIQGSLKDLSKPKQQSAFGDQNTMMLFAMLAMNRPAPAANVVVVRRRGCW